MLPKQLCRSLLIISLTSWQLFPLAEITETHLRISNASSLEFQKVIYNLAHKRRKERKKLLQKKNKSLQKSHSRITRPPFFVLLVCLICFVFRGLCSRRPRESTMRPWQTAVSGYSFAQQADGLPNTKSKDVAMLCKAPQYSTAILYSAWYVIAVARYPQITKLSNDICPNQTY